MMDTDEHPQRTVLLPRLSSSDTLVNDNNPEGSWFTRAGRQPRNVYDQEKALPGITSHSPLLKPAQNPPKSSLYDYVPLFKFFKWVTRCALRKAKPPGDEEVAIKKKKLSPIESNVPLQICLILSRYETFCLTVNRCSPSTCISYTACQYPWPRFSPLTLMLLNLRLDEIWTSAACYRDRGDQ